MYRPLPLLAPVQAIEFPQCPATRAHRQVAGDQLGIAVAVQEELPQALEIDSQPRRRALLQPIPQWPRVPIQRLQPGTAGRGEWERCRAEICLR